MDGRHAFRKYRFLYTLLFLSAVLLGSAFVLQSCGGEAAGGTDDPGAAEEPEARDSDAADPDAADNNDPDNNDPDNNDPDNNDGGGADNNDGGDSSSASESGNTGSNTNNGDVAAEGTEQAADTAQVAGADGDELAFDVRTLEGTLPMDNKEEYMAYMREHTNESETYLSQRWDRSRVAIGYGDFEIDRIREAFLYTPREHFAREWNVDRVYDHTYLGIGYGQTISGPHIVITMTESINPQPDHKVLEIGTGSGYQSAFLARLSNHVYTIEIVEPLAVGTDQIYTDLEDEYPMYGNVTRKVDDGYYGWEEYAPFDRIIVTAGIDHIPPELIRQLAPGGQMVIPVGPPSGQTILKVTKVVEDDGLVRLIREDIYDGRLKDVFVPFTSSEGGTHNRDR